ncbi:MAG: type II secretion system protein [Dechloromonas sp.]|jgi:MSHA pilin protein MshC|nr:type II secretion system protein [Dechloromonas sp.]
MQRGFTLTELVVTIVIAGILAAVALPRFFGDTGFEARQFRDETVAALRLAQKSAIAARRTVCASFAASQVDFRISSTQGAADCSTGAALGNPSGGGDLSVSAPSGVSFSPVPAALVFDSAGRPGTAASLTVAGLESLPVTVEAETGYVH